jgi:integrase
VVFYGPHGGPLSPTWLYKLHRRVCALASLHGNRVHDLRHSYATLQLYECHAPVQYVSEQLGHASIKITVDTYGHPRQGPVSAWSLILTHQEGIRDDMQPQRN